MYACTIPQTCSRPDICYIFSIQQTVTQTKEMCALVYIVISRSLKMCSVQILLHDLSVDKHRIMLFRTKKKTFILCSEMPPKRLFIRKDYSEQVPQTVPRSQYRPVVDFCSIPNGLGETGQAELSSRCVTIKSHSPSQGNLSLSLLYYPMAVSLKDGQTNRQNYLLLSYQITMYV